MDYYEIIAENFQATIEAIAMSVDDLASAIEGASQLMAQALLEDRKIIACGNGADTATAQLFTTHLIDRFDRDRPALPALALGTDGAGLTAIARSGGLDDIFARQLRALGHPGDVLLCCNSAGTERNLLRAVQAAHERDMSVVALTNSDDIELGARGRPGDIEIRVDFPRRPRRLELHTMIIHSLCELLDHSLFGPFDPV
jgi:phosphoheptose isomerase